MFLSGTGGDMEPNEGEDLISFLGRAEREVLYGDTFTDSAGTVPTRMPVGADGQMPLLQWDGITPAAEVHSGGHTYRRIEAGKPVLPPACATLAGLLAFVLAHPSDGGAVAGLADRLIESEDREREVPEVVGALVDVLAKTLAAESLLRDLVHQMQTTWANDVTDFRDRVASLEADNRALRERVGQGAR